MTVEYIIHPDERGGYWAEVPALPGCVTEGRTLEELASNVKDAATGCLEVILDNLAKQSAAVARDGGTLGGNLSLAFRALPVSRPARRRREPAFA